MMNGLRSLDKNFTPDAIKAAVSVPAIAKATTMKDLLFSTTAQR
jgi:hypothetical protein